MENFTIMEKIRGVRALAIFISGWGMAWYSQSATWHKGSWLMLIGLGLIIITTLLQSVIELEEGNED